jgi:hypothetical protein
MNLRSGTSYLISAFRSLVVVDDLLISFPVPLSHHLLSFVLFILRLFLVVAEFRKNLQGVFV